ncbi:MAG: peptide chain release factor N(5)-glutamine methyltransferase [Prevotella sp.]|nr:peptide chain release factor N(5)-glutamine methyltransferase [Prevotella sp.]
MTYRDICNRLTAVYETGEARAIARLLLEEAFGLTLADICSGKDTQFSAAEEEKLNSFSQRLLQAEPIQYVLGSETFCGRRLSVRPGVLIPRPETEELCRWVTADWQDAGHPLRVLDVGTGSGCIAVTMALDLPQAEVEAWDISPTALEVAQENARLLGARVTVREADALHRPADSGPWHIIVSNPPYIAHGERTAMHRNVTDYEPAEALYVDDPMLFYRALADYYPAVLPGGAIYMELNPVVAHTLCREAEARGWQPTLRRDVQGLWRMIRLKKP